MLPLDQLTFDQDRALVCLEMVVLQNGFVDFLELSVILFDYFLVLVLLLCEHNLLFVVQVFLWGLVSQLHLVDWLDGIELLLEERVHLQMDPVLTPFIEGLDLV